MSEASEYTSEIERRQGVESGFRHRLMQMTSQRDDLLAACKELMQKHALTCDCATKMMDAVARAEGEIKH